MIRPPPTLIQKDPIVTVQKDGEAAYGLSPKRSAKQYAATIDLTRIPSIIYISGVESPRNGPCTHTQCTIPLIQGTLRSASYKKTKVSACGAPGAAED